MAGASSANPRWKRVVLKLSGEALAEPSGFGLDSDVLHQIATELHETRRDLNVDIAVVVGGGNFWRGLKGAGQGMDQAQADYMGMIATVMNALALQDAFERVGQFSRVMTAVENGTQWVQTANGGATLLAWNQFEDGGDITLTFDKQ